jgi:hypothetical protein
VPEDSEALSEKHILHLKYMLGVAPAGWLGRKASRFLANMAHAQIHTLI